MSTPKLPASVRVGALDYAIKPWSQKAADNTRAYGMCDRATLVILIQEDLTPQKQAEVLLHEILHACYDNAGLNMEPTLEEERVVNGMGYQLLQVIRDNPKLMVFLQAVFTK